MHGFLRARIIAPLLHLVLFVLVWIPNAGRLIGARGCEKVFRLLLFVDFPVIFLWLATWIRFFGLDYGMAVMLILGTVWWFFLGWLIELIVSLYRRR